MPTFEKSTGFNMKNKGNFNFSNTGNFDFNTVTKDQSIATTKLKKKKKRKKTY